jgi:predicted CopG family antitoxin
MSTKTIALDSTVYTELARNKRESESFSKAIARMLQKTGAVNTGADILARMAEMGALSEKDADLMLCVVKESRVDQTWPKHDLS